MRFGVLVVLASLALAGCSSEVVKPPPPPPPLLRNDTPQHTILYFMATYEQKRMSEYQHLFTNDFTYEFSNSTDPDLVSKYSYGWFRNDERESSTHLFQGFTPPGGSALPAASSIDVTFNVTLPVDDIFSPDPETHKVLPTRVDGTIVVPPTGTQTDPTNYLIVDNYNQFWLVRGDQAASLDADQPADASHWYIYRWVDLTQPAAASDALAPTPTNSATWGKLKALYR